MAKMKYPEITVSDLQEQAKIIRDIAQSIMDACEHGTTFDAYARAKLAGGDLARDAAALGIMLVTFERASGR